MPEVDPIKELLTQNSCCIIIPTYNNAGTLLSVIDSVKPYAQRIIVVNDGSTDQTSSLLSDIQDIDVLEYADNRGKGFALRTAFLYARKMGFRNAITIDSDGQHFAKDIPAFLNKYLESGPAVIVGERRGTSANKPKQNTFANKFSNFWFRAQTGNPLQDTQCGFRWYPLDKVEGINYLSSRYEFELEVLVRNAWRGIPVCSVPVDVHYAEKDQRVSHFRPFTDFARISLLNTVLTLLAIAFFRPKLWVCRIFSGNRSLVNDGKE